MLRRQETQVHHPRLHGPPQVGQHRGRGAGLPARVRGGQVRHRAQVLARRGQDAQGQKRVARLRPRQREH